MKPTPFLDVAIFCCVLLGACSSESGLDETVTESSSNPKDQALLKAIRKGNFPGMEEALRAGANPNTYYTYINQSDAETGRRRSALELAALMGNVEAVRVLIQGGAKLSGWEAQGALWAAARAGHADVLGVLFDGGADARTEQAQTALAAAASNGQAEAVRALLAHGVPADTREAQNALNQAVIGHHTEVVQALLVAGTVVTDKQGYYAREEARQRGFSDLVEMLKNAGAPELPPEEPAPHP